MRARAVYGLLTIGLVWLAFLAVGPQEVAAPLRVESEPTLEDALARFSSHDLTGADSLFAIVVVSAEEPRDRARAARMRGLLAWRYRLDFVQAAARYDEALEADSEVSETFAEMSRMHRARRQFSQARTAAGRADQIAETDLERLAAAVQFAWSAIDEAEASFEAGEAPPAAALDSARSGLTALLADNQGDLSLARPLLRVAILTGQRATALDAWRSYYLLIVGNEDAGLLDGPRATLTRLLSDSARALDAEDLGQVVEALADAAMFPEAQLAARAAAWTGNARPSNPRLADILAYGDFLAEAEAFTTITISVVRTLSAASSSSSRRPGLFQSGWKRVAMSRCEAVWRNGHFLTLRSGTALSSTCSLR